MLGRIAGALTTRGWGLVAAGLLAVLLAWGMGRKDLLALGIFLIALPPLAAVVLRTGVVKLRTHRTFSPALVHARGTAKVALSVSSTANVTSRIRMWEGLPGQFGKAPEFGFPGQSYQRDASGGYTSSYEYAIRPVHRGVYLIGPAHAELSDVLQISRQSRVVPGQQSLLVAPALISLATGPLSGSKTHDGAIATSRLANPSEDDLSTREYQYGDPLRRVHWGATARHQQLMVRREESVTTPQAAMVLDLRESSYPGRADAGGELRSTAAFEWTLRAAMSIGAHYLAHGYQLRCLDTAGAPAFASSRSAAVPGQELFTGSAGHAALAESLAGLELQEGTGTVSGTLLQALAGQRRRGPVLLLTGELSMDDAGLLADAAGSTGRCAALCCTASHSPIRSLAGLTQAGWYPGQVDPSADLAQVWAQLGGGDGGRSGSAQAGHSQAGRAQAGRTSQGQR